MFAARWIMAPIYIGLLLALVMVVVKFVQKLVEAVPGFLALSSSDAIFLVLTLVDLSLVANLVVIVIFAGWENFVGRLLASELDDQPAWLGGMDFATVKLRLIGSIVAIAAIQILETSCISTRSRSRTPPGSSRSFLASAWSACCWRLADKLSEGHERK